VSGIGLVGNSSIHRVILERLARFASTDAEILITGPTGVGKELYARFVHRQSPRPRKVLLSLHGELLKLGIDIGESSERQQSSNIVLPRGLNRRAALSASSRQSSLLGPTAKTVHKADHGIVNS